MLEKTSNERKFNENVDIQCDNKDLRCMGNVFTLIYIIPSNAIHFFGFLRDKLVLHFGTECPNEVVECVLPGCSATFLRKESYAHHSFENASHHLQTLWLKFVEGNQNVRLHFV